MNRKIDLTEVELPIEVLDYLKYRYTTNQPKKFIVTGRQISPRIKVDSLVVANIINALQNDIAILQAARFTLLDKINF